MKKNMAFLEETVYQEKLTGRHVAYNCRNIIFVIPPTSDGYPKISHAFSCFFICNRTHNYSFQINKWNNISCKLIKGNIKK